ncbi:response regulator [Dyadobacter psychrotolerans]|uniref:Response regulator n=1 Tax=Dyadobacter psychrotolerans TaxID=2541721 RepID=A0A4R5DBQ2_9BACT|nr:response regulator [Dyadobacter psychrotolerans]TDE08994.1 response regulator [Dyadobacter psychrotolerans]
MTPNAEWTVYLVDDDDDDVLFFEMAVNQTHSDCIVSRCVNGKDLISMLGKTQKIETSLIFLDLTLPSLNGIEILRQVRALALAWHLPVFILSGSHSPNDIVQAYQASVTGYLLKPAFQDQWTYILDRAIHFAKKLLTKS